MWVDTVLSLHDWKLSAAVSGITDVYDGSHEEEETFIFTCLLLRYNILEASRYKKSHGDIMYSLVIIVTVLRI